MWPDLPKGVLYMHSFKTHFLSPFVSYINGPTVHVLYTVKGWTVCFHSGLFLKSVWCPWVLRWTLNGPIFPWQADNWLWITTRLADEFVHGFRCFDNCVTCGGENGTNGSHLVVFSKDIIFARHFVAPRLPPTLPSHRSASGIGYTNINYLTWWAIQLAIQCTADTVNYFE